MTSPTGSDAFNRRKFLQTGGLALASAAVLAACGKDSAAGGSSGIPRLGVAPTTTGLPDAPVTDLVLLRTAQSVEHNAIDAYAAALELGVFTGSAAALGNVVRRFQADHRDHSKALGGLIAEAKGETYECANPQISKLYVTPALDLIVGNKDAGIEPSDTPLDDLLVLAHGLESLAAATYQYYVSLLSDPALRAAAMGIGEQEGRHATVLAQAINPGVAGVLPSVDPDTGRDNVAAVPSTYGSLRTINVAVGKPSETGSKPSLNMETPSLNSMIYDYMSCS